MLAAHAAKPARTREVAREVLLEPGADLDPAFALDLVTGPAPRPAPELRYAVSNSFAFGGTNAVLVAARTG